MRMINAEVDVSGERPVVNLRDLPPQPLTTPGHPVALAPGHGNRLNVRRKFVYMDVGRWGGTVGTVGDPGRRDFGIVYGTQGRAYVAVGIYNPTWGESNRIDGLPYVGDNQQPFAQKVISFLNHTHSRLAFSGPFSGLDTSGKLYLFVGDLHLPLVSCRNPHWCAGRVIHFPCRVDTAYMRGLEPTLSSIFSLRGISHLGLTDPASLLNPELWLSSTARTHVGFTRFWWERYIDGDIFTAGTTNAAADDLKNFLTLAHEWQEGADGVPIDFVQLGDMYELWVGLKRFFESRQSFIVDPCQSCPWVRDRCDSAGSRCQSSFSSQDIVRNWVRLVGETTQISHNGATVSLAEWLDRTIAFSHKQWIYGNHENYLRVMSPQLPMTTRVMNDYRDRIFFEHGHQGDEYNRDGEARGHDITQGAAFLWSLRAYEEFYSHISSERRHGFIKTAVKKLLDGNLREMGVYVMAHTHQRDLALVEVTGA